MTYPGGSNQVTYGYDNANCLASVTDWGSNAIGYAYDDAGRMTTKTLPSGTGVVSAYTYDNADRLTGISHVKGGSTTLASVAYKKRRPKNATEEEWKEAHELVKEYAPSETSLWEKVRDKIIGPPDVPDVWWDGDPIDPWDAVPWPRPRPGPIVN